MNLNDYFHRCISLLCHAVVLFVFLTGFLPFKSRTTHLTNQGSEGIKRLKNLNDEFTSTENHSYTLKKSVFIVIDALRADFIFGEYLEFMPFLKNLHRDHQACSYLAQAHTPTVTLPRIKALMTGTVPGFADVIFNLGNSRLEEDNLVDQLITEGHKIVFYGDDTWLKLFPGKFIRSEGTTSFFVNDFYEVDENVTRHLDFELNQTDWSFMILHYLGLDHIGHVQGPKSSLVPQKLIEMDNVIKKIYNKFYDRNTSIVICGDHGISDSGSHGGSSKTEIEVPVTFILEGCRTDPEPKLQIDVAPTLAVLMGVPIPSNNLGSLILSAIDRFQLSHKLHALFMNAQGIALKAGNDIDNTHNFERATKLYDDWLVSRNLSIGAEIAELFLEVTSKMSSQIIERIANFDIYLMVIAIFLSFQLLIISCLESGTIATSRVTQFSAPGLMCLIVFIASVAWQVMVCLALDNSSSVCFNGQTPILKTLGINITVFITFCFNVFSLLSRKIIWKKPFQSTAEFFLLAGSLIHGISLGASSYVEEEHQTYYFLVNTLALLLINHRKHERGAFSIIGFMVLLRIARRWNQTGDKWINEPDVQGWLNEPPNKSYLATASIIGATGIFLWIKTRLKLNKLQLLATAVGLVAILAHRNIPELVGLSIFHKSGVSGAAITYGTLIVIGASSRDYTSSLVAVWIVLTSLLRRPHNLFLTLLNLVQYSMIRPYLASKLRPFYVALAHYWIGMVWYFQQGNGNSLAKIDIASGYVGLESYNIFAVGFLLTCSTFSGPILALLLCLQGPLGKAQAYGFIFARHFIVTMFFIIILLLRYHLFVWTVFSPKLLYEGALSLFLSITLLLVHWD